MPLLNKLEKKYARYVPENITKYLLAGQVVSYLLVYSNPAFFQYFILNGSLLLRGEVWRIATFLVGPVSDNILFVFLAWYFFYLLGTALENQWGSFRYVMYIAIAWIATVTFTLLFPYVPVTNTYLYTSLFLAFTTLYPNYQVLLFFIIPVKVKWLGYLAWFGLISTLLLNPLEYKFLVVFSVLNYLLFFWDDLRTKVRIIYKGLTGSPKTVLEKGKPKHVCAVCGKNEIQNPDMEIRYCRSCFPETCYCGEHIRDHQHKRAVN